MSRKCARSTIQRTKSRSEEHTSELQSQSNLVCRLLLESETDTDDLPPHGHVASGVTHRSTAPTQSPRAGIVVSGPPLRHVRPPAPPARPIASALPSPTR